MFSTNAPSYYKILEVSETANQSEIKSAYINKARKLHPDKNINADTTAEMQMVIEAYKTLSDPAKRSLYDAQNRYRFFQQPNVVDAKRSTEGLENEVISLMEQLIKVKNFTLVSHNDNYHVLTYLGSFFSPPNEENVKYCAVKLAMAGLRVKRGEGAIINLLDNMETIVSMLSEQVSFEKLAIQFFQKVIDNVNFKFDSIDHKTHSLAFKQSLFNDLNAVDVYASKLASTGLNAKVMTFSWDKKVKAITIEETKETILSACFRLYPELDPKSNKAEKTPDSTCRIM